ncbi:MAG: hypothetical protein D6679_12610 [Candidatus Hydrogenedentota bacterium]|nr:MAG: hypothetical protein D6679_12610 [Candidatus Hydrogenedentota bacterium]
MSDELRETHRAVSASSVLFPLGPPPGLKESVRFSRISALQVEILSKGIPHPMSKPTLRRFFLA